MKEHADSYTIQAVSRALDLLEQFQESNVELGISDLSNRLKLQKNNVFRLVATLRARHYIEINDSTGKYRLGLKTRALGQAATRQTDFLSHARPVLHGLKNSCHETCYFSIIKDSHTYYLDGVESDLPVRVAHRIGSRRPLHCTAAGKVQLAFMLREDMIHLLGDAELKRFTPSTITDPELLQAELRKIALQGYAIEDQEHDAGVMEIAAPVFDGNGALVGALSISGPAMRFPGSRVENELVPLIRLEALRLSNNLGHRQEKAAFPEISKQIAKPIRNKKKTAAASCAA
jgi:IclR family KDG regulon transcriptional repressor